MKNGAVRKAAWLCLPFTGATALCRYLLPVRAFGLFLLCCGVLFAAGFLFTDRRRTVILLAAAGLALGCSRCWLQQRFTVQPAEALSGQYGEITARVTDYPDVYDGSEYLTVRLTGAEYPRVRCRLISYVPGELASFRPGDELRCRVRFTSASFRSGQEIDTYTAQGIFLRATCAQPPEYLGRWRGAFLYLPRELCRRTAMQCRQTFPADAAPFMTALLTGDKTDLYKDGGAYYALGEAGLAHVVAVSGMHLSCLIGFLYLLLGRNRLSGALGLLLIVFFSAMTGFTPSVTRAAFMHGCLICAPLLGREEDAATSLSVVLAGILMVNPMAVAGASLQMSFASMAGIYLVSTRLLQSVWQRMSRWKLSENRILRPVLLFAAGAVSVSLGAQLFTVPLAAAHFGYVSVVSPLSGVLCLWMISGLFIGGYAAAGIGALFPAAGALLGKLLAWGVRYIFAVTRLLRLFPCEAVYTSNPVFAVWLAFVYVIFLVSWLWNRRKGSAFRVTAPLCLALSCLWCFALLVRLSWKDDLTLTALDVGQGESVVLTSGPRTVMVDCGGTYLVRDAGETAVQYLGGRQRRHLDALILSHLHADHVSGAARVLSQLQVEVLYMPAGEEENSYLAEILAAAAESGTRVEYVDDNRTLQIGKMKLQLWAPLLDGEENENCLTVLAGQDDFEALITGDNPAAAETVLSARYALPDVEVLVVGHHGSLTSTCDLLLREIRPDVAVISVGYNNYGHPAPQVLDRLADYGVAVHRTDLEGTVTVRAGKGS